MGIEIVAFSMLKMEDPVLTKPSETTANTYTNADMQFSVVLPKDWYGNANGRTGEKFEAVLSYPIDVTSRSTWAAKQEARISIIRYPSDGGDLKTAAKAWLANAEKTTPKTYDKEIKERKIGGKDAVVITSNAKQSQYIYVNNADYTYYLTISTPTENLKADPPIKAISYTKHEKMFEEILASFTFLN